MNLNVNYEFILIKMYHITILTHCLVYFPVTVLILWLKLPLTLKGTVKPNKKVKSAGAQKRWSHGNSEHKRAMHVCHCSALFLHFTQSSFPAQVIMLPTAGRFSHHNEHIKITLHMHAKRLISLPGDSRSGQVDTS